MKLLVGLDLTESTEKIIKTTEGIAKALSAKVWLLHVAEPEPSFVGLDVGPQSVRDSIARNFHIKHRHIQEVADGLRAAGLDTTALLVQGATVEEILREASKLNVDMIVVGSRGGGMVRRLLVGSVSEGVLRKTNCPIIVVPTHERNQ